jgi:hypothetical protein
MAAEARSELRTSRHVGKRSILNREASVDMGFLGIGRIHGEKLDGVKDVVTLVYRIR